MVFSICLFSVQYRIWESDRRTFRVGFNLFHQKMKFVWCITVETGRMELEIRGNGKDTRAVELHIVWEKFRWIVRSSEGVLRVEPPGIEQRKYQASLLSYEALVSTVHEKIKASETSHVTLLYYTYICSEKNSQTYLHYLHKTTPLSIPLKLETRMGNCSTAFSDLNCAHVWLMDVNNHQQLHFSVIQNTV